MKHLGQLAASHLFSMWNLGPRKWRPQQTPPLWNSFCLEIGWSSISNLLEFLTGESSASWRVQGYQESKRNTWNCLSKPRWWFQIFCYFHPYLGKIPILTNIFQMGWNHQPETHWSYDPSLGLKWRIWSPLWHFGCWIRLSLWIEKAIVLLVFLLLIVASFKNQSYPLGVAPSQDSSGKWRFSSGSPSLKTWYSWWSLESCEGATPNISIHVLHVHTWSSCMLSSFTFVPARWAAASYNWGEITHSYSRRLLLSKKPGETHLFWAIYRGIL